MTYREVFLSIKVKGLITRRESNMEDREIVDLYWAREERAITETERKYGRYCYSIAHNILLSYEDSEECVNDTYLKAWGAMPQHRPNRLGAFLGKITRNLALNRWEHFNAEKRGAGQMPLVLDELQESIPASDTTEQLIDDWALTDLLNWFLASLHPETRKIFMRRYWYLSSIKEIAADYDMSQSSVKMSLMRTRKKLKNLLEKEGIAL